MAKIVLTKRESKLWREGNQAFQKQLANSINQLAGDLGGYGIDLIDEDGNSLSLDDNEFFFQYMDPSRKYSKSASSQMIFISHLKDN